MNNDTPSFTKADEAMDFLLNQDLSGPKVRVKVETSLAVDKIESIAHNDGLQPDQIENLVKLATSGKYADSVSSRLIKSLIPQGSVPSSAVVIAGSRICNNRLSISIKGLLIRWILNVFNLIDDLKDVHSLYGIFFLFLESDILCPHICHLLYYLTRKEDVRNFRIRKLLDLQSRVGIKPYLTGLLFMYKIHCPNLVTMATSASNKKLWFKQLDKSWKEAIKKVQNKYNPQEPVDSFFLSVRTAEKAPITKRRKLGGISIPAVQTAAMGETKISIEQLSSFKDLLENIDNIEFPSQVASVLNSPFLQHVLSCNPDFVMLQRLNFWLNHSLYEEFLCGTTSESDSSSLMLLQKLKNFAGFLQESVPAVEAFLVRYLFIWNGLDFRPWILHLITHLSLWPFQRLNDLVLEPLRKLFFSSPVYVKCQVMYCLTELLRNFLAVELPRQQELLQEERSQRALDLGSVSLFVEDEVDPFDPLKTIYDFIQFVDRICVVALQVEEDHALLQHWVLNFFELVSTSYQQFSLPFVLIPSSGIIYRMLFSCNSMAVSRLCQIIVNYKKEFESLKASQAESQSAPLGFPDGFQSIQRFNQYILDICDSLWRNKAFIDRDKSFCFSMPSSVTDPLSVRHMNELFSIHHHISLVGEAWKFLHQTQPAGMKLTPSLIKGRSRRAYMEYLKQRNFGGILVFLETFIRPRS
ncbi:centromere protein I-like [Orbicella faveolata]|uniref:centromere protein I-like n=1 Tax=Orbicella faveolata TaxID=48498 RepID=UPI0009E21282|nr:centromere protein I-like [Orbicella faveolata]